MRIIVSASIIGLLWSCETQKKNVEEFCKVELEIDKIEVSKESIDITVNDHFMSRAKMYVFVDDTLGFGHLFEGIKEAENGVFRIYASELDRKIDDLNLEMLFRITLIMNSQDSVFSPNPVISEDSPDKFIKTNASISEIWDRSWDGMRRIRDSNSSYYLPCNK